MADLALIESSNEPYARDRSGDMGGPSSASFSTGWQFRRFDGDTKERTTVASTAVGLLEPTLMRMAANDAATKTYRIHASFGVFRQAFREIESLPQIPRPTFFRIWKTLLIANVVVGLPRRRQPDRTPSPHT
jgi:hypothetical protein